MDGRYVQMCAGWRQQGAQGEEDFTRRRVSRSCTSRARGKGTGEGQVGQGR